MKQPDCEPLRRLSPSDATRELASIRKALDRSAIVAITDRRGNITHVNDRFCEISKYSRDELLGQNHRIINSGYHPAIYFKEMWDTITNGQVWEGEVCNKAKDGSYYWVHTTIVPFLDQNQKPYEYVSIRFEITEKKRAEEQLKVYASQLEFSNRELQDFASVAAHDLQEPLRKIVSFADRIFTKYDQHVPDEMRDYMERIIKSTRRMQDLIDDLLSYSRVTSRAQPFKSTNLNEVLRGVLDDLELSIEESNALISSSYLPTIDVDKLQMRQLLQNLIGNSLKFRLPNKKLQIEISAKESVDTVSITVKDNGIGFDQKYADRIFTIFQRLHGKDQYPGTGLGLAVCRKIVERHGGQIYAQSELGAGALFTVVLPRSHGRVTND